MNWTKIIADLIESGFTQAEIGKTVGLTQPSIAGIADGSTKSVKWEVGQKILSIHKRAMRKRA